MSNQFPPPGQPGEQPQPGYGYPQPGQPQQPGWGHPTPPPQPKKSVGKIVGFSCLGVVGLFVVLGVAGALLGTDDSPKAKEPAAQASAPAPAVSSAPAKAPASKPAAPTGAKADVKITACELDTTMGWAKAELTITNGSSKKSNYMVSIEFVNASGTRLGEAIAATNNLAPGQAANVTAQGLDQIKDKITCKVTEVTRYAS